MQIYIGWDSREAVASEVARHSIIRRTESQCDIRYLKHRKLRQAGLFKRPWIIDGATGNFIDMIDGRQFSTEFSHTRFLVPHLCKYQGWALFFDADMIFLSDVVKLFALADPKYAVMCVKHKHQAPPNTIKMDNRLQFNYYRKNWSSFMLFNCEHPANKALSPSYVNYAEGSALHAMSWLKDSEIGDLPPTYNYISGVSPKINFSVDRPDVIHYTEGGPWFDNYRDVKYGHFWTEEYEDWQKNGNPLNNPTEIPTVKYD